MTTRRLKNHSAPMLAGMDRAILNEGSIVVIAFAMSFAAVPLKTSYVASKHAFLGIAKLCGE